MSKTVNLSARPYHLVNVTTGFELSGVGVGYRTCLTLAEARSSAEAYARRGVVACLVCEIEDVAAPWDRIRTAQAEVLTSRKETDHG